MAEGGLSPNPLPPFDGMQTVASSEQHQSDVRFMKKIDSVVASGGPLNTVDGNMKFVFKAIIRCRAISNDLDGLDASLRISSLPSDCQLTHTAVKCPSRYLNCAWLVEEDRSSQTIAGEPMVGGKWQSYRNPVAWPPILQ